MNWLIATAEAQTAATAQAAPNPIMTMLPMLLIFVVFYFMLIRPQNKKAKEHRAMLEALQAGNEVATGGGIVGKVTEVGDNFVAVEIADNVVIKVQRNTIAQVLPKGSIKTN